MLLVNFGNYVAKESRDKEIYNQALTDFAKRVEALETLGRTGFTNPPMSRSAYAPFQQMPPSSQGNRPSVATLNDQLDALERLLKGADSGEQNITFRRSQFQYPFGLSGLAQQEP